MKEGCVSAYERAQDLRRTGKLIEAREALITCSQPACPSAATVDCTRWLGEVEQSLPSVVVSAHDARGHEVADLRVLVDGAPLAAAPSGLATPIDPGVHTFRYESSLGPAVEESVTIREGEKNRAVSVALGPAPALAAASAAPSPSATSRPIPRARLGARRRRRRRVRRPRGLRGDLARRRESPARDLRPHCPEADVHAIRVKHTIADIGLGVGVASLSVATVLFFTRPAVPATGTSSAGTKLQLAITGNAATLQWTF